MKRLKRAGLVAFTIAITLVTSLQGWAGSTDVTPAVANRGRAPVTASVGRAASTDCGRGIVRKVVVYGYGGECVFTIGHDDVIRIRVAGDMDRAEYTPGSPFEVETTRERGLIVRAKRHALPGDVVIVHLWKDNVMVTFHLVVVDPDHDEVFDITVEHGDPVLSVASVVSRDPAPPRPLASQLLPPPPPSPLDAGREAVEGRTSQPAPEPGRAAYVARSGQAAREAGFPTSWSLRVHGVLGLVLSSGSEEGGRQDGVATMSGVSLRLETPLGARHGVDIAVTGAAALDRSRYRDSAGSSMFVDASPVLGRLEAAASLRAFDHPLWAGWLRLGVGIQGRALLVAQLHDHSWRDEPLELDPPDAVENTDNDYVGEGVITLAMNVERRIARGKSLGLALGWIGSVNPTGGSRFSALELGLQLRWF